jgi:ankyrin repeat protein
VIQNGNLQQVRSCLEAGGLEALETRDRRGNRALHLALKFAHRNATAIVKALLVRRNEAAEWH